MKISWATVFFKYQFTDSQKKMFINIYIFERMAIPLSQNFSNLKSSLFPQPREYNTQFWNCFSNNEIDKLILTSNLFVLLNLLLYIIEFTSPLRYCILYNILWNNIHLVSISERINLGDELFFKINSVEGLRCFNTRVLIDVQRPYTVINSISHFIFCKTKLTVVCVIICFQIKSEENIPVGKHYLFCRIVYYITS